MPSAFQPGWRALLLNSRYVRFDFCFRFIHICNICLSLQSPVRPTQKSLDCSVQQLNHGDAIQFAVSFCILWTVKMSCFDNCSFSLSCSLCSGVICSPSWAQTYPISICINLTGSEKDIQKKNHLVQKQSPAS